MYEIIITKRELYDKCENMEELYDNFYCPLLVEYKELKKQVEEKDILIKQCELSVSNVMDCYCERTDCSGRIKDSKVYDSLVQKVENSTKKVYKLFRRYVRW